MADNSMTTRHMAKSNTKPPQTHVVTPGGKKGGKKVDKDNIKPSANASTDNQYVCSVCKNIDSLRSLQLDNEVSDFLVKLSSIKSITDQLTDTTDTISDIDNHLKHILLNKPSETFENYSNKLQSLDEDVKCLSKTLNDYQNNLNHQTDHNTEIEQNCTNIFNDIQKLFDDFEKRPPLPPATPVPSVSDNKIINMCEQLLNQQKELEDKISIVTSSANVPQPHSDINTHQSSLPSPKLCPPTPISHSEKHIIDSIDAFLTDAETNEVINDLSEMQFVDENGHSVLKFGAQYRYRGSHGTEIPEFPSTLKNILDKLNTEFCNDNDVPKLNSCLVNKYCNTDAHLPEHSDNESTIAPESNIFSISLGSSCKVSFRDIYNSGEEIDLNCKNGSMYIMSRHSQDFFKHRIDNSNMNTDKGVRYSLTFRTVDWRHRNSTCIIGDSNTGKLKFGTTGASFGAATPGKRVWASNVDEIDPTCCSSYTNIVLLCGINDIRHNSVNSPQQIRDIFCKLKSKIAQIQAFNNQAFIFVCPILPTKLFGVNKKASYFNQLIYDDLLQCNYGVSVVLDFASFVDETGFLSEKLSKSGDALHLDYAGVRKLATMIKTCIFFRKQSKSRSNTVIPGRLYTTAVNRGGGGQRV